ncbi:MAG: fluoride efflux transporter CrcB [Aestuariivita sp.]|nr:fluoride efflux transporter CrcB [Aestuariivita sp.]
MSYFWVAIGGGLGSALRLFINQQFIFPYGTMFVNICGSFAIGIAFVFLSTRLHSPASLLLMTGLLGGFTTFSAFSLDALKLWQDGNTIFAILYITASVFFSILFLVFAVMLARTTLIWMIK